jgi:hypothetical protein
MFFTKRGVNLSAKKSTNKKLIKSGGGFVAYPGSKTKFSTKEKARKQLIAIKISQGDFPGIHPIKKTKSSKKRGRK